MAVIKPEDKPWLKNYFLGPYELEGSLEPYPSMPLHKILDDSARKFPQRVAIQYFDCKITYKNLKRQVDSLANALAKLGVKHGDRVAMIFPTCPQYVIAEFAILKAGAAVTPCSTLLKASELEWEIGESGAEVIICQEGSLGMLEKCCQK
jgi:long-chain acyl-CoA synthetase